MARFNPTTPDSLYGELQPEAFGTGMKGELFGPEIAAAMMPTEDMSQSEKDKLMQGLQQEIIPLQEAYEAAQARRDKQEMEQQKFMMAQESQRMALRSANISFEKSKFDLAKSYEDANREASIAERMPIVVSQLDAIDRDPTLDNFQRASAAARLQGHYAPDIAKSPALKSLFEAYQTSNKARISGDAQAYQRGFGLGQQGYAPDTTLPEFAAGQQATKEAAREQKTRTTQLQHIQAVQSDLNRWEERINDLDTMYHPADSATGGQPSDLVFSDGGAPKVDRTKPKVYTKEAKNEAVLIARKLASQSGMSDEQLKAFVKGANDMTTFVPMLKEQLWRLKTRYTAEHGVLSGYATATPTAPSIGSWGAPST